MTVAAYIRIEVFAGAVLAGWIITRFPKAGPKGLASSVAVFAATLFGAPLAPYAVPLLARLPFGLYLGLVGVILPMFVAIFLAAGWLLRQVVRMSGGSGGGGHRRRLLPDRSA
jgi:hypothetical protein